MQKSILLLVLSLVALLTVLAGTTTKPTYLDFHDDDFIETIIL